nr:hypothetical protein [Tanacetum cinerariifolium]
MPIVTSGKKIGEVNIDTLSIKQYLALTRGNHAPGVVKPYIGNNVNFEIKGQFMRELREDTFSRKKNDDAHEHDKRVLDIVSLFNTPRVTHDAAIPHIFPITLTGATKRWFDKIPSGTINTWYLLKNSFIQRYCPSFKTAKQLEEIHNFKQEGDRTLYQTWERSKRIKTNSSDGITAITSKLDSLGRDMKKLKENMHDIQVFKKKDEGASRVLSCQLPPKKSSPGSFTLPCTIGSLNMYALANLVEMENMSKKATARIVENVLVKIDKFVFPFDFVVIDMLRDPNETMILDPCLSFHIIFAMSTQQDIYPAGSKIRPPMLNKENYVPWSSRLLRYAKTRPNGKLIHNSIINGPYVRRMIPKPGETNREVPVNETFHVQTDDELTEKELKQIEADDQAIHTIFLGLPEDIYAAVDSCETA